MAEKKQSPEHEDFPDMIRARTANWIKEVEGGERWRTAMSVTLHRREQNDYHGYWDSQLNSYLEVPNAGLMKWPIIGPVIRTHCNNWLSTRLGMDILSDSSDPEKMGGENVAKSLFAKLYSTLWTDMEELKMALYCQCEGNWFGVSGCTAKKGRATMKVPTVETIEIDDDDQNYQCAECGAEGQAVDLASEKGADLSQAQKCPECGQMSAYADTPSGEKKSVEVQGAYEDVPEVDNFFTILPSFLFRVDEVNCRGGDLKNAQYVNMSRLSRRFELRELYGADIVDGLETSDGKTWTDPVKWWHALETGAVATVKDSAKGKSSGNNDDDLLQESIWWISPAAVANWKAPKDYKVSEKCPFKIKKGQTFAEAFGNKKFVGLYVALCGSKVLWVDNESHNETVTGGIWLMNSASFWGKSQQELNDIQEAANAFFTLFYEYGTHATVPHRIIDEQILSKKDFKNRAGGITITKKGAARSHPIKWYVEDLPPGRLSPDMHIMFQSLVKEGAEEIGAAPKAVVGQGDAKNRTLGGQQLLAQRGLSALIPSQKSKGAGLIRWGKQQLTYVQKYWSNEQIRRVLSKTDQSWEDQDISAFREMDLERDLTWTITAGTDIPVTHSEKEQKLAGVAMSGILWNPQIPVEIRSQIAKWAGIDYDPDNVERERRHQAQVLKKMKSAAKYMEAHGTGYLITAETGTEVNPEAIKQILSLPGLELLPQTENLDFAVKFFNAEILAQHTAEHPDQLLLSLLTERIQQISEAIQQADMANAQRMAQAKQQIEDGAKDKDRAAQAEENQKDREHELAITKEKNAHSLRSEQMKQQGAQRQEMNDKVPDFAAWN